MCLNILFFQRYIAKSIGSHIAADKILNPEQSKKICKDFDKHNFDLRSILNLYSDSRRLLMRYERRDENGYIEHRLLENGERNAICKSIVDWAIDMEICLKSVDYPLIFDEIKLLFPMELLTVYYTPSTSYVVNEGKNATYRKQQVPSGQLYRCYKSNINKARKEAKQHQEDLGSKYRYIRLKIINHICILYISINSYSHYCFLQICQETGNQRLEKFYVHRRRVNCKGLVG